MRTSSLPLIVGLALAVVVANDGKTAEPGKEPVPGEDAAVIEAALKDLAAQKDLPPVSRSSKRLMLLHVETYGPAKFWLSDDQLRADLGPQGWAIPADLLADLRRRNTKEVSLREVKFGKNVALVDLDKLPPHWLEKDVAKQYAEARGYAVAWLPGYSKDRTRTVVRFWYGPTAHGATGTFLLTKEEGAWKVTKRAFAFYL
jgi:hypothetical protein